VRDEHVQFPDVRVEYDDRDGRPAIEHLEGETHGEVDHRPGARLSAGSQTVLPTVRFSPAQLSGFSRR
jgi:hypothetical protein